MIKKHGGYWGWWLSMATLLLLTAYTQVNATPIAPFTLSGPITGQVYHDYNSDGNITTSSSITDTGVQGVTVSIYGPDGSLLTSTQTAANGSYSISVVSLGGVQGPYRVEFSGLPSGYESSRKASGTQNNTSVQFINADTASARTLNFGVLAPQNYCQANPNLATNRYYSGDPLASSSGSASLGT